jgi:hypothetical protein
MLFSAIFVIASKSGVRVNGRNDPILLVEQLQYGYHSGSSISHKPRLIRDKVLIPIMPAASFVTP